MTWIEQGMSMNTVSAIMGRPDNLQFELSQTLWEYCSTHNLYSDYVEVWFDFDYVIEVRTDRRPIGMCENGFRQEIDWSKAPIMSDELLDKLGG